MKLILKRKFIFTILIVCLLFSLDGASQTRGDSSITFLFMGDIMQHDGQIQSAYDPVTNSYDYSSTFKYVKPIIQKADVAIANLEVTLAGPPFKGYPQFSAPDELAIEAQKAGIDVLVTANNHSLDRRQKGVERTIDILDELNFLHTGTFKDSLEKKEKYPLIFYKNGFKIALLNYTYGTNGIKVTPPNKINYIDEEIIKKDIAYAKSLFPDITIVFMHWGLEYQQKPSREQINLAETCKKSGADLVIGSHPHVVQPVERDPTHPDKITVYSLGNFISNQRTSPRDGGMMVEVTFSKKDNDKIQLIDAGYYLTWVYRSNEPRRPFYILPATSYEFDSTFVQSMDDREKMASYFYSSRKLFSSENKGIAEYRTFPKLDYYYHPWQNRENGPLKKQVVLNNHAEENTKPSPVFNYSIQIIASSKKLNFEDIPDKYRDQVSVEYLKDGTIRYFIGSYSNEKEADTALGEIKNETSYKDAFIVKINASNNSRIIEN